MRRSSSIVSRSALMDGEPRTVKDRQPVTLFCGSPPPSTPSPHSDESRATPRGIATKRVRTYDVESLQPRPKIVQSTPYADYSNEDSRHGVPCLTGLSGHSSPSVAASTARTGPGSSIRDAGMREDGRVPVAEFVSFRLLERTTSLDEWMTTIGLMYVAPGTLPVVARRCVIYRGYVTERDAAKELHRPIVDMEITTIGNEREDDEMRRVLPYYFAYWRLCGYRDSVFGLPPSLVRARPTERLVVEHPEIPFDAYMLVRHDVVSTDFARARTACREPDAFAPDAPEGTITDSHLQMMERLGILRRDVSTGSYHSVALIEQMRSLRRVVETVREGADIFIHSEAKMEVRRVLGDGFLIHGDMSRHEAMRRMKIAQRGNERYVAFVFVDRFTLYSERRERRTPGAEARLERLKRDAIDKRESTVAFVLVYLDAGFVDVRLATEDLALRFERGDPIARVVVIGDSPSATIDEFPSRCSLLTATCSSHPRGARRARVPTYVPELGVPIKYLYSPKSYDVVLGNARAVSNGGGGPDASQREKRVVCLPRLATRFETIENVKRLFPGEDGIVFVGVRVDRWNRRRLTTPYVAPDQTARAAASEGGAASGRFDLEEPDATALSTRHRIENVTQVSFMTWRDLLRLRERPGIVALYCDGATADPSPREMHAAYEFAERYLVVIGFSQERLVSEVFVRTS